MRGIDGFRNSFRRRLTAYTFGLFVVLYALAMNSFAMGGQNGHQYIPRGQPIPQGIRYVNQTATGVNTSAWATWTNAAGQTSNHRFPVPVSSSTLGRLASGAMKKLGPAATAYMTMKSILDGIGWFIDEARNQVVVPGNPQTPLNPQGWCTSASGNGAICVNSSASAKDYTMSEYAGVSGIVGWRIITVNDTQVTVCGYTSSGESSCRRSRHWYFRTTSGQTNGYPAATPDTDVTDYDLGQLLKQHPEVINAVLIDPETGMPIRTPELVDALNDLRRALEAANGVTTPGTDLVVEDDWEDQQPPNQTDWPELCTWGKVICDFIDWFKLDPDPPEDIELPYEEKEIEWQQRDSGLGSGSCPAPTVAAVFNTTVEFGYEGICGFMDYMRPVAIACAWISAAFIVVNARPARF